MAERQVVCQPDDVFGTQGQALANVISQIEMTAEHLEPSLWPHIQLHSNASILT